MKNVNAIIFVLLIILAIFLAGCSRNAEQDVEAILDSELLAAHGIAISVPDSPYYKFMGRDDLSVEIALQVLGEHGVYHFESGGWTDVLIADIVLSSEDGISFAKDFLGIEVNKPLSFVFNVSKPNTDHPLAMWGGGGVFDTTTYISMETKLLPSLVIHEAVHAILRYDKRISNFPYPPESSGWAYAMFLEEGLSDMIDFLFARQTDIPYRTNYGNNSLHTAARRVLNRFNHFSDETEFGVRYPQLMSYETSASFIYFLLEYRGGIDDFMRVFDDIYLMETVYGKSMEDMIAEWLEYLDRNW